MTLKDELERSGEMLFRWRSYPPALFYGTLVFAMRSYTEPENWIMPLGVWELLCVVPIIAGLGLRMWAIGTAAPNTSGGNRSGQMAEALNTTGAYSMVRHPLYLGALFAWTGVSMLPRSVPALVIVWLLFWIYYERIMIAEESFLQRKFGDAFTSWAARVPAFMPTTRHYVTAKHPFSMRRALRREYSAWLAAVVPLYVLKLYGDYVFTGVLVFNRVWLYGLLAVIMLASVVRFLKHFTGVLKVQE